MADYPIPSKSMRAAMEAHTNLTVFASVVELLEGGLLSGYQGLAHTRIITICKDEQQRLLKQMDKAVAAAQKGAQHG